MTAPSLTVTVDGKPVTLTPVRVSVGLVAPLTCGHRYTLGDTVWHRADLLLPPVRLRDPCARFDARRDIPTTDPKGKP